MVGEAVERTPLVLRNEFHLGPTWTDVFRGSRKVARVYTYYYRNGKDKAGNELPQLPRVLAPEDDAGSSVPLAE